MNLFHVIEDIFTKTHNPMMMAFIPRMHSEVGNVQLKTVDLLKRPSPTRAEPEKRRNSGSPRRRSIGEAQDIVGDRIP